jgi:hypothetical protein
MTNATETIAPRTSTPHCPDWCTRDHARDLNDPGSLQCSTASTVLGGRLVLERAILERWEPIADDVDITLLGTDVDQGMTAAQARELASVLLAAADLADTINAAVSA